MSILSVEKLHAFHAQERDIFCKLVLIFSRPPAESLLVMATWLWFEDFGFGNIFSVIKVSNDSLLMDLADEAVFCLKFLEKPKPSNDDDDDKSDDEDDDDIIPLTKRFMTKKISFKILNQHRYTAITGIKNFLTIVCSRIFSDILQKILPSSSSSEHFHQPFIIPGFPHPVFGNINVMPYIVGRNNYPNGLWGWNARCIATVKDRTLFLTFSRGFPVSLTEVKQLFTYVFGEESIEEVFMQGNDPITQEQSLYARLVVDSVATVDLILYGKVKQKYRINGKHIWARKFENRDLFKLQQSYKHTSSLAKFPCRRFKITVAE